MKEWKGFVKKETIGTTMFFYAGVMLILFYIIYNNFSFVRDLGEQEILRKELRDQHLAIDDMESDSDGDGLKDWQEILYGTFLDNADTDGDGVNDGQEVKVGTDPLVVGIGSVEQIQKIQKKKEEVFSLEQQREIVDQKYQEQVDFQKRLQELREKIERSKDEQELLDNVDDNVSKIKSSMNRSATIIRENTFEIANLNNIMGRLFVSFSRNNEQNLAIHAELHQEHKDILLQEGDYREVSEGERANLRKYAESFLIIADFLDQQTDTDTDWDFLRGSLSLSHQKIGESIVSMLDYREPENITENNFREVLEYTSAMSMYARSRKNINNFVDISNIVFSPGEVGKMFVYSL